MLSQLDPQHEAHIALWFVLQHSLRSYRKLLSHFESAQNALELSAYATWKSLGLHDVHLQRLKEFHAAAGHKAWQHCRDLLLQHCDTILLEHETLYPQQLLPYEDRPPLLFVQGQAQALIQPQVAVVGSRKPSRHGKQIAFDFAHYLATQGFFVCSGLAQGIDEAAHRGGVASGRSIAVMATGIERTYPLQNEQLRQQLVQHGGAVVTEFLPQSKPLQHHFPRRNRIVSGLSLGIVVAEATLNSGSLITAKLALDQGKTVFAIPGHIYDAQHAGCHQLIREGAILIDHPQQIIEELALATAWQYNTVTAEAPPAATEHNPHLPPELCKIYQQLDWTGQDLDQLALSLQRPITELTHELMQLELLGYCVQQAGLYMRCRRA